MAAFGVQSLIEASNQSGSPPLSRGALHPDAFISGRRKDVFPVGPSHRGNGLQLKFQRWHPPTISRPADQMNVICNGAWAVGKMVVYCQSKDRSVFARAYGKTINVSGCRCWKDSRMSTFTKTHTSRTTTSEVYALQKSDEPI